MLFFGATFLSLGCAPGPSPQNSATFAGTVRRAIRLVRPSDPKKATYLEELLAQAEAVTASESASPWWRRSPGRSEAAWLRTVTAAAEAARGARLKQSEAHAAYRSLLSRVRTEVAEAREQSGEAGMGRRQGRAVAIAVIELETAQRLASGGQFDQARTRLERASEAAATVRTAWEEVHRRFTDSRLRRQWARWAELTIEESRIARRTAIVVDKLDRSLNLYHSGLLVASFPVELGANGLRRKLFAGDRATPEGMYRVVELKDGKETKYYKALLINYPNEEDRARYEQARRRGEVPRRAGIGSLIEIHGGGGEGRDWTDGCVALTNDDMTVVYARAQVGTPVTIVGSYGH